MSTEMWINAFTLINPTTKQCEDLGREVLSMLKRTASRDREPLDPMFELNLRIVAS